MNKPELKLEDIVLGQKYKDKVTNFEGTAIGITTWLTGCATIGLRPVVDKEGKLQDSEWFDVIRLEEIKEKVVTVNQEVPPGGPHITPKQNLG